VIRVREVCVVVTSVVACCRDGFSWNPTTVGWKVVRGEKK